MNRRSDLGKCCICYAPLTSRKRSCRRWGSGKRRAGWCATCLAAYKARCQIMGKDWHKNCPLATGHAERIERYIQRATAGLPLFEEGAA